MAYNNGYSWTGWQLGASDGQLGNQDFNAGGWQNRCMALDSIAGQTAFRFAFTKDVDTPPGKWDLLLADLVIDRADGAVQPLFTPGMMTALTVQSTNPSYDSTFNAVIEDVQSNHDPIVPATAASARLAHYFTQDHLGTAQLELSAGGWPVWTGQLTPYGAEMNPQPTANHYKFTGKERDAESGNDYFGARYYENSFGRFMSPDWSAKAEPVPYAKLENPQTLNLYAYVNNNPMNAVDPDGHQGAMGGYGVADCAIDAWGCNESNLPARLRAAKEDEKKRLAYSLSAFSAAVEQAAQQQNPFSRYVAVGDNGPTHILNGHIGRDEIYDVRQIRNGKPGYKASNHDLELHETILDGTKGPHTDICDHGNCRGRGTITDSQGTSFRDPPLTLKRTFTIDGQPAYVWNPRTNKMADYQILHLTPDPGLHMEYKP